MPEIVKRGHIYIAQPPLYKVKFRKDEAYIKDDYHLENHLLNIARQNVQLLFNKENTPIREEKLEGSYLDLAKAILLAEKKIIPLELKVNRNIIDSIIDGVKFRLDSPEQVIQTILDFNTWVKRNNKEHIYLELKESIEEPNSNSIMLVDRDQVTLLDESFFNSKDYNFFHELSQKLEQFESFEISFKFSSDDEEKKQPAFRTAVINILKHVEEKITLQRYKGLGEMNPDQLWETTMDPATRILSKVEIKDESETETERIFVKLMGEEVAPRKEFIQENALNVTNLDV
tara:strand:- start:2811 stop:3674 length:864 start_codon:yes stop_codon:yes gene_type:complete